MTSLGYDLDNPPSHVREYLMASHLLWRDAGCPPVTKPTVKPERVANCAMCGQNCAMAEGVVRTKDAFGPGFTDHDKLSDPRSSIVCVPCVWLLGGQPPMTLRTWSVLWREDWTAPPSNPKAAYPVGPKTWLTAKNDMSHIREILFDPPPGRWVCSIADSGQIHTAPFATVNQGGYKWCVRFDREDVISTRWEFTQVVYHAMSLLVAGFVRDDLLSGTPHPSKLVKHGIELWKWHWGWLRKYRRSPLLALVLMLAKREEYDAFRGRACEAFKRFGFDDYDECLDGRHLANGLVAPSAVGPVGGGVEGEELVADGDADVPQAANPDAPKRSGQLSLFDWP